MTLAFTDPETLTGCERIMLGHRLWSPRQCAKGLRPYRTKLRQEEFLPTLAQNPGPDPESAETQSHGGAFELLWRERKPEETHTTQKSG